MKHQRFALFAILSLVFVILGCTSATPDSDNSANAVTTTNAARSLDDRMETTLLSLESRSSTNDRFVNSVRQWTDNESRFSTNAELVSVSIKNRSIKLLKENGVMIEVSIDRLSTHDRNFLKQAVHALRDELVSEN